MSEQPSPDYLHWDTITTRWMDNDMYGHVNNVQYYSFFDTVVTSWLVREGGLDPAGRPGDRALRRVPVQLRSPAELPGRGPRRAAGRTRGSIQRAV